MSTNIKNAKSGSFVPPMDAGSYPAVCCGVIDLGLQKTSFRGRERNVKQIQLIWEFPYEPAADGKQKWLSRIYTFSNHKKSRLRSDLINWRGRDFTEDELEDFDIARVMGIPCIITVTQTRKNGNTYANVNGVGKLMKGLSVRPPVKKLHFDMDDPDTWPAFAELPGWIQQKINGSLTFKDWGIQLDKDARVIKAGKI